jgi:hypothetical protein
MGFQGQPGEWGEYGEPGDSGLYGDTGPSGLKVKKSAYFQLKYI